jgi:hypothetical protein
MINGTLVAQIVHFLIVCFLIHAGILRYLVSLVMAERAQNADLAQEFDTVQESLAHLLAKKAADWAALKRQFVSLMPFKRRTAEISSSEKALSIAQPAEKQLADDRRALCQAIIKKVTHVNSRTE